MFQLNKQAIMDLAEAMDTVDQVKDHINDGQYLTLSNALRDLYNFRKDEGGRSREQVSHDIARRLTFMALGYMARDITTRYLYWDDTDSHVIVDRVGARQLMSHMAPGRGLVVVQVPRDPNQVATFLENAIF